MNSEYSSVVEFLEKVLANRSFVLVGKELGFLRSCLICFELAKPSHEIREVTSFQEAEDLYLRIEPENLVSSKTFYLIFLDLDDIDLSLYFVNLMKPVFQKRSVLMIGLFDKKEGFIRFLDQFGDLFLIVGFKNLLRGREGLEKCLCHVLHLLVGENVLCPFVLKTADFP